MTTAFTAADNKVRDWFFALAPFCLALGIFAVYLISPAFYLTHFLEGGAREYQAVELGTVTVALLAGVLLAAAAWRIFRLSPPRRGEAALFAALAAAAAFFLAGEEINWGQIFMHWGTTESTRPIESQTNLHNTDLPIQNLGSWYLILAFFVTPAVWRLRSRLNLPPHWALAVPRWPVIAAVAASLSVRPVKFAYRGVVGEGADQTVFYVQFLEQINEVQELLVAVAFLIYALDRMTALRALARPVSPPPAR